MKKIFILNLFILLLAATVVFSQNKVLLLNGKTKEVKSYELKGDWLMYQKPDLCEAVIFTASNLEVANKAKYILENYKDISYKDLKKQINNDTLLLKNYNKDTLLLRFKKGKYRKGDNTLIDSKPWVVGLTSNEEINGAITFIKLEKIIPDSTIRKMDRYNIFSAVKPDGLEEVIYDPDTSLEGDPTVEQVRRYIRGEQYGMAYDKTPWNKVEGAAVGFGSGVFAFYGPAVVFANSMIMGRINPNHIPPTTLIEPEVFNSEEFGAGYKKYARNKKIKDTLIFGGIGFAAGFTFFSIIFKD